jgi:hypothetical protein
MEYYGRERELSRTTKPGQCYGTLPQEGQTYLARAFLSKKNAFADEVILKFGFLRFS